MAADVVLTETSVSALPLTYVQIPSATNDTNPRNITDACVCLEQLANV